MNEEIEKVYVELVDTLKKHLDVKQEHIDLLKQKIDLLEQAVMKRDELLKIYEIAMAGTESAVTAKEMMDKVMEERQATSSSKDSSIDNDVISF